MDPQKQMSFVERFFLGKITALRYGRFIYQLLTHLKTRPHFLFISVGLDFLAAGISYLRIFMLLPLLRSLILADHEHLKKTWVIIHLKKISPALAEAFSPLTIALSGFLGLSLMHILCTYFSGKLMDAQSRLLITQLRSKIYRKILITKREFQEKHSLSKLNSLISRNVESLAQQLQALHQVISENLKLLSFGLSMLSISWRMTLITLAITGAFNLVATFLHRRLRMISDREKQYRDGLDQDIFQSVTYLPLFQSMGTENREYLNFSHHSAHQAKTAHEQKKIMLTQDVMEELAILGALLAMAVYMIVFNPARTASEASIYLLFFFLVRNIGLGINSIDRFRNALAMTFNSFRETLPWLDDSDGLLKKFQFVAYSRPIEPLAATNFHQIPQNPESFPENANLKFDQLHFSYEGKQPLFRGVNLEFSANRWTTIMGASGCGKSSLIHLFYFQYTNSSGDLLLGSTKVRDIPMTELRKNIAYVPHESLFFSKTIRENLTYGITSHIDDKTLLGLCEQFELNGFFSQNPKGLDTRLGEMGARVSAGEKQRLALVRVVLRNSPIYVFDEATSALDIQTEVKILTRLQETLRGKMVIFISHRPSALAYSDDLVRFESYGNPKKLVLRTQDGELTPEGEKVLRENSLLIPSAQGTRKTA